MAQQLSANDITYLEVIVLNHRFANSDLLQEAVRASQPAFPLPQGNRKLALVGDAVLKVALLGKWYTSPGSVIAMALARLEFVASDSNLVLKGTNAGLGPFIIRDPGQQTGPVDEVTMARTVKAILGAVYIDVGQDIKRVEPVMRELGLVPV